MIFNQLIHFLKSKTKVNSKSHHGNSNKNNNRAKKNSNHRHSNSVHGNKNNNLVDEKNANSKSAHNNKKSNHVNNNNHPTNNNPLEPIQSSAVLLSNHTKLMADIYHHSHVPKKHFEALYLCPIKRLAVWVQSLPGSQNHHHAHHGGFLRHTLEVVEIAIKQRNTKMLPIGASVERQNEKKDLYTFAVFTAALLHDIGKTISDIHVMLYDNKQESIGRWSPWFGAMSSVKQASYYQYQHNRARQYQQHSLLSLSFLREFIRPKAIDWMQQDPELFGLLLMTLQGRQAQGGVIADIVKYADSRSSANSLANQGSGSLSSSAYSNNPPPQGQPPPKSLADKLLDTMRYLVLETDIKTNTPGAVMFTTDKDIYFVSKVIMDMVRDSLNQDNQTGIPLDNSRMMDELLQFHIITPNSKGKAIWHCALSGGGFKKPVHLTMLKMPLERIYYKVEDDKDYEDGFAGDIVIKDEEPTDNEQANNTAKTRTKASPNHSAGRADDGVNHNSQNSNTDSNAYHVVIKNSKDKNTQDNKQDSKPKANITQTKTTTKTNTTPTEILLPMPPGFDIKPNANTNANSNQSSKEILPVPKAKVLTSTIPSEPLTPTKPIMTTPAISANIAQPNNSKQVALETELGQDFLQWLLSAINNKTIQINTTHSRVHIVTHKHNKALFLVSPKIFKDYDIERWARVQKQFGRLRINLKTKSDENIWQVQTITQRQDKKPSKIQGYLIINLECYGFAELPAPNGYLDLIVD